jgi:hypothetical protein
MSDSPIIGIVDSVSEAPLDGTPYERQDGEWIPAPAVVDFLGDLQDVDLVTSLPGDGERLAWDETAAMWVPRRSTSALGIVAFNYRWEAPISTAPPAGRASSDNADPTLVTMLYVNKFGDGAGGPDNSLYFENAGAGDWMNLAERDDSTNYKSFDLIGAPILVGDIWEIPVVWFDSGGVVFTQNDRLALFIKYTSAGVTDHTELVNIGTNTHDLIDAHIADTALHNPIMVLALEESVSVLKSELAAIKLEVAALTAAGNT